MKEQNPTGPFIESPKVTAAVDKASKEMVELTDKEYHSVLQELGWLRPWRWVPGFWSKQNWVWQYQHMLNAIVTLGWLVPFLPETAAAHTMLLLATFIFAAKREYFQYTNWDWKVLMLKDRIMDVLGHLVGIELLWRAVRLIKELTN